MARDRVAPTDLVRRRAPVQIEAGPDHARLARQASAHASKAELVVLAHAGVDERIDGRARVGHHVRDPLDVRPPGGRLGRVLDEQQHALQRRPAHEKHHKDPNEHNNYL